MPNADNILASMTDISLPICVAALYKFAPFDSCAAIQGPLLRLCRKHGLKGTLLLAPEGINGTIAGSDEAISHVLAHIRQLPGCAGLEVKFSRARALPFHRMKVRLKREIVTMGEENIDPLSSAAHYVAPEDWNALISDPATILIDTRNDYEVQVGSFAGAINPNLKSFRDFPAWFQGQREKLLGAGAAPKIAMFCTGGIRCEKSTAYLKAQGLDSVYHLQGGILKYLEQVPREDSLWQGECFVFDQRVTVAHGLAPGSFSQCHACRRPVGEADKASPLYEEGVSCPACHDERTDAQRASYRERHRQENIAAARGHTHIAAEMPAPNREGD